MRQTQFKKLAGIFCGSGLTLAVMVMALLMIGSCKKDSGGNGSNGNNGNNGNGVPVETATLKYIPDSLFRAYLKANICPTAFDKTGKLIDITNSQVANFSGSMTIDTPYAVASLKGIQYFSKMTKLTVNNSFLDSLDLSASISLDSIYLVNNIDLQYMNVSGCNVMRYIRVSNAPMTTLDFSNLGNLNYVSLITLQRLKSLNVNNDNNLQHLITYGLFSLTSCDVSSNANLLRLLLEFASGLTSIDVTHNPKLTTLYATYCTNITTVDITKNPDLSQLSFEGCGITNMDFSKNPQLFTITLMWTPITSVSLLQNPKVRLLWMDGCTQLTTVDIRAQTSFDLYQIDLSKYQNISEADMYQEFSSGYLYCSPVQTAVYSMPETAQRRATGDANDLYAGLRLPQYLDAGGLSLQTLKISDATKNNYSIVMARRVFSSMTPVDEIVYSATDTTAILCHDYNPETITCSQP